MSDDVRMFARRGDIETDITEGVRALYDLAVSSMDFRSGFWTAEDAAPVALLGRACGFKEVEEVERYLRQQQHSDAQQEFLRKHPEAQGRLGGPPPHDHVFSPVGKCMWPQCVAEESALIR